MTAGTSGLPRGGGGLVCSNSSSPPKFRRPFKIVPNSTRLWKLLKIAEFRTPTHQDVWKKGTKIIKLLSIHNRFTLAMTNKLVVIINSLKVPTIKKILLYEMKFLVRNYSCLQNPWLGGYSPPIPVFCPQLNLLNTPPPQINLLYVSTYFRHKTVELTRLKVRKEAEKNLPWNRRFFPPVNMYYEIKSRVKG